MNTYPTNIPVQAGDIIGVYGASGNCGFISSDSGNSVQFTGSDVPAGSTATFSTIPMGKVSVSAHEVLQPGVSSVSPSTGSTSGGTQVTITGHDFTGATAVVFGGTPALGFTVNSDASITAVAPPGAAGPVDVRVTTPGGLSSASASDTFAYVPGPGVNSVSPSRGPRTGGTRVTITGHDFVGVTGVSFGGRAAKSFSVLSTTSITAVAPAATIGTIDVRVTTPFGQSAATSGDRFTFRQVCIVPKLKGKTLKAAKRALRKAHCGVGKVKGPKTGKVKRQSRRRGLILPAGTKVRITLG